MNDPNPKESLQTSLIPTGSASRSNHPPALVATTKTREFKLTKEESTLIDPKGECQPVTLDEWKVALQQAIFQPPNLVPPSETMASPTNVSPAQANLTDDTNDADDTNDTDDADDTNDADDATSLPLL